MRYKIPAIVHLDGPDKVGKSSINKKLIELSEGNLLVIDRSYLSQITYAEVKNRTVDVEYFKKQALEAYKRGEIFIFLNPTKLNAIHDRFKLHNETDLKFSDYEMHLNVFRKKANELKIMGCDYFNVDTTIMTIDESVERIFSFIRFVNKIK